MREPDWETLMISADRSARTASRNSENAVSGIVKVIDKIDRNQAILKNLQLATQSHLEDQGEQIQKLMLGQRKDPDHPKSSFKTHIVALALFFVAGAVFGAYIWS